MDILEEQSIVMLEVNTVQMEYLEWIKEIMYYIVDGKCPRDKSEARKLGSKVARYCTCGVQLYKRSFSSPLLRCIG